MLVLSVFFALLPASPSRAQTFESGLEAGRAMIVPAARQIVRGGPPTAEERRRSLQITFLFENESVDCRYDYIEDLHDGRGYTAGCIGFNVRSGTIRVVIERYLALAPAAPAAAALKRYLPEITRLESVNPITSMPGLAGFDAAWTAAAQDPAFRRAQDEEVSLGFDAAVREADLLGVRTPLGRAILYDTQVQHGMEEDGPDPDSMPPMIRAANRALGGTPGSGVSETKWLKAFLAKRRKILANPHDPATRGAWATSVDRVDAFSMLLRRGNLELLGPIDLRPYFPAVIP